MNENNGFDRDAYKKARLDERNNVYELLSDATQSLMNADKMREYIDMQAKLFPLSVSNVLLIMTQMPEATWVRPFDDWKKDGVSLEKGEKGILILDSSIYQKSDGSLGRSSSVVRVFDISQTNAKERLTKMPIARNPEELILRASPCRIESVSEIPEEEYGSYDRDTDTVFIKKDLSKDLLFYVTARELLCRALISEWGKTREEVLADASAAAVILSKRYGVNPPEIDVLKLITTFPGREEKDVRKELTGLKNAASEIDRMMTGYLKLERAEKENER